MTRLETAGADDRPDQRRLATWVRPSDGSAPYEADFSTFFLPYQSARLSGLALRHWGGDFSVREQLADEFMEHVLSEAPSEEAFASLASATRNFSRYLDNIDPDRKVGGVADINEVHGMQFRQWLSDRGYAGGGGTIYQRVARMINRVRQNASLPPLAWPPRDRGESELGGADFDEQGIIRLTHALRHEIRQVKRMFREGEELAALGCDPRVPDGVTEQGELWSKRECHAHLILKLSKTFIPDKDAILNENAVNLIQPADRRSRSPDGPLYLAPGMTQRGSRGVVGKLRWAHPSAHDTALFLWLFLLATGWNLSTSLGVDVSSEEGWVEPHPTNPLYMVIHAWKNRSDAHVFAVSLEKPEFHPYRIVKYMCARTAIMRATVLRDLAAARRNFERNPSMELERDIVELERVSRSPWLYHSINKVGRLSAFDVSDAFHLNQIAQSTIARHGLEDSHPSLLDLTTSIGRDAWIGHAYVSSGYQSLIAQMAAQHGNRRSLRHYLRNKVLRRRSFATVMRVQDHALSDIYDGRPLDPTRLRILVTHGHITVEQEARLIDLRMRTRLGMACLSPRNPPRHIAPDHKKGSICTPQRCTGCEHGVVFEESLTPLARALAELHWIKRSIPLESWRGSSFETEEISISETLALFDTDTVRAIYDAWLDKLRNGERLPHDAYPA